MATVLIGLGGSGCKVIDLFATRLKGSTSVYSEMMDNAKIAFWSIDADKIEYTSGFEQVWVTTELKVRNAEKVERDEFQKNAYFREWFDPQWRTYGHINGDETPGAGQIKMNGRFAFYYNIHDIENAFEKLTGMSHIGEEDRYYVITSMFGGTGSGMYYDLVYFLQSKGVPASEIRLFLLDPSVLEVIDPQKSNSYSWISAYPSYLELDFYQSNQSEGRKSLQYSMHYSDELSVHSSKYLSKPVFLFGGKDQNGRSLKNVRSGGYFENYQRYVADILYELSFAQSFKQYTGKNTIDNIEENLVNDHSNMYASIGLTYILFPKEKIKKHLCHKYLTDFSQYKLVNNNLPDEEQFNHAHSFLHELGLLQYELNQITMDIDIIEEYKNWRMGISNFKEKIQKAKKKEILPRRPFSIRDENLNKAIKRFVQHKLEKLVIPKNLRYHGKQVGEFYKFSELLGFALIPSMLNSILSLPDIIGVLKNILFVVSKEISKVEEIYGQSSDLLGKGNYPDKYAKIYQRLRTSKNRLFKKDFTENKTSFIKIINNYEKLLTDKLKYEALINIYSRLKTDTEEWISILKYLNERALKAISAKIPDSDHTLRKTPFVFDKEKSEAQFVSKIYFGDNLNFIKSPIIAEKMKSLFECEKINEQLLSLLLQGNNETDGFVDLIGNVENILKSEGSKALNENYTIYNIENRFQSLFDNFILTPVNNKIDAINFSNVLEWQFEEVFSYMKNLKDNFSNNPKEFQIAKGQFKAMFGDKSDSLLTGIGDKKINYKKWSKEAIIYFFENIAKGVEPLWQLKSGNKPKYQNQFKVVVPENFDIKIKSNAMDIFQVEKSSANMDRIGLLKFAHTIPLTDLDFISDDMVKLYELHKKEKLGAEGHKSNPVHSDYRFYNLLSWDLFKSHSEMQSSVFTMEFALGFVLSKDDGHIMQRKKTGYFYYPSARFTSKSGIKLGTSYFKAYRKIIASKRIANDLVSQIREKIKTELYALSSAIERVDYVRGIFKSAIAQINSFKPPQVANSDAYDLWEQTIKNLTFHYEQINEINYIKMLKLNEEE